MWACAAHLGACTASGRAYHVWVHCVWACAPHVGACTACGCAPTDFHVITHWRPGHGWTHRWAATATSLGKEKQCELIPLRFLLLYSPQRRTQVWKKHKPAATPPLFSRWSSGYMPLLMILLLGCICSVLGWCQLDFGGGTIPHLWRGVGLVLSGGRGRVV